jgi:hypothetical protein
MDVAAFNKRFERLKAKFRRTAYLPRLGAGNRWTHFGGSPLMFPGEAWPACQQCHRPMIFLLEFELSALPKQPPGDGVLQMFFCSNEPGGCKTYSPFSGTQFVRIASGALTRRPIPPGVTMQADRSIVGWEAVEDFPSLEEHAALGLEFDLDYRKMKVRIRCREIGFDESDLEIDQASPDVLVPTQPESKLFGWPFWVQRAKYPGCPECGRRMDVIVQLASHRGVEIMFGDVGIGHISQCADHPHVLAFGWQGG